MHVAEIQHATSVNCQQFKHELSQKIQGGYNVEIFTQKEYVARAVEQARMVDTANGFYPNINTSKVYQLVEDLFDMLR